MAQQEAQPDPKEKARVRNTTRSSLLVKVPGQSIHLLPGQMAEVPRAYLDTDELSTLLRNGAVLLTNPAATASAPTPNGETPETDEGTGTRPPRKR